jgi:hypothetical protein
MAQPSICHHLHRSLSQAGAHGALGSIRGAGAPDRQREPTFWELWRLGGDRLPATSLRPLYRGVGHCTAFQHQRFLLPTPAGLAWAENASQPTRRHRRGMATTSDRFRTDMTAPTGVAEVVPACQRRPAG